MPFYTEYPSRNPGLPGEIHVVLQLSGARLCAFHMNDCKKKKKLCRQKMGKNPKRALISETITSVYQLFFIKIVDGFVITFLDMKCLHYSNTVKKFAIF